MYFSVFWIPILPIGKEGLTKCNSCKAVINEFHFDQKVKEVFESSQNEVKASWHSFIGISLFFLILIFLLILMNKVVY